MRPVVKIGVTGFRWMNGRAKHATVFSYPKSHTEAYAGAVQAASAFSHRTADIWAILAVE